MVGKFGLHNPPQSLLCLHYRQIFFEGVEARVSAGVKPEEVGFQFAFSKQELRKVVKEYPAKEVRRITSRVVIRLKIYPVIEARRIFKTHSGCISRIRLCTLISIYFTNKYIYILIIIYILQANNYA